MSAQLVTSPRCRVLKPTKARARGGELTGLASTSSALASSMAATQARDPKRWGLAIDAYYGEPMPAERQKN